MGVLQACRFAENQFVFMQILVVTLHSICVLKVEDGDGPRAHPRCLEGQEKYQMTNFDMPNNVSFMKYALKSVPGVADVGDPHGDGDGPRTPP